MYQSFEDLDVWKRACQMAVSVYEAAPRVESVLATRPDAACRRIGALEHRGGCERGGRDFIRFLSIARGSAAELRTQCYIACKVGVLTTEQMIPLVAELKEISKMMTGLAQAIQQRLDENG